VVDQTSQVEVLKGALGKLEQKLAEAHSKSDLLMAQHRRSRTLGRASDAHMKATGRAPAAAFDRMKEKVLRSEAVSQAKAEMVGGDLEERFAHWKKEEETNRLLGEIKSRRSLPA